MPFVKLDCGILDSSLWIERESREIFITALLMSEPREFSLPMPQIHIDSLEQTGWVVPPGWYGFIPAAASGIIRRALVDPAAGLTALKALGSPEADSRTRDFEGRRLVRVDGGFVVLNYMKYRERDYTAAERQRRHRQRIRNDQQKQQSKRRHALCHGVTRNITQAEAEAEVEVEVEKDLKKEQKIPFGELKHVRLTAAEYDQLGQKLGTTKREELIAELDEALGSKGYRYKSHYATVLSWHRKKNKESNFRQQIVGARPDALKAFMEKK
jgi:hypothetical protein